MAKSEQNGLSDFCFDFNQRYGGARVRVEFYAVLFGGRSTKGGNKLGKRGFCSAEGAAKIFCSTLLEARGKFVYKNAIKQ